MFQMRAVFAAIIRDDEERKSIIDLVEKDLRATGYADQQVGTFLTDLLASGGVQPVPANMDASVQSTRRLRSPFAMGFESAADAAAQAPPPPDVSFIPRTNPPTRATAIHPAPIPAPAMPRGTVASVPRPIIPPTVPAAPAAMRTGSNPSLPTVPSEPMQPAGQKSLIRHDLAFGKVSPSIIPPGVTPPTATPAAPGTAANAAVRPTVLVADDDKRIRLVFRLRLEASGYIVIELGDGQEAWNRLQEGGIDLVVLDMKMPGLHGLEVLSRMVDKQINIPVIVCSAYDQLENEFVVQTHPKLKYLVKPVSPDALVAAVRELLLKK